MKMKLMNVGKSPLMRQYDYQKQLKYGMPNEFWENREIGWKKAKY